MAKFCVNCGAELLGTPKFCPVCGNPPEQVQTPPAVGETPIQKFEQPSNQQPAQPFQPPHPSYQSPQPDYGQPYGGQNPVETGKAKPKKKGRVPRRAKILVGFVGAGIVTALVLIFVVLPVLMKTAAALDYYKIVDDNVPTVKLALGEERKVTGVESSIDSSGVHRKTYSYEVVSGQNTDMSDYTDYLMKNDGFSFVTDYDFSKVVNTDLQLARNSSKDGYMVVVQLDYDLSGYTVTLMWGEGKIEPPTSAEPSADTVQESNSEQSVSADIELEPGGQEAISALLTAKDTYTLKDEAVTSITAALGITRELVSASGGGDDATDPYTLCKYSVPGSGQGMELNDYRIYLTENEGFLLLTDVDFNRDYGSGVRLGKNAKTAGYIVILDLVWDTEGYTITMSYLPGTVTPNANDAQTQTSIANPAAYAELPPFLQELSDGIYTYGFSSNIDGTEIEGYNTQRGSDFCSAMKYTIDGTEYGVFTIIKDGYTYSGDAESKTATKHISTAEDLENLDNDYSGYLILERGEGNIDGVTLPYIEYGTASGDSYGKYYLQNGDVYAVDFGESIMYITEYYSDPETDFFEIPASYTVTED